MEQENLPTELILDILSRLSVKTLVRLRSVSRAWLSLISDPFFKHLHRERSQKKKVIHLNSLHHNCSCDVSEGKRCIDHLYSYMEADECLLEDELVFVDSDKLGSYILPSNGGSLLCHVTKYDILVCNPSSRELLTLPRGTQYFYSFIFQGTITDPPRQYSHECMIGFAYLYVKNEYRIVRLFYKRRDWNFNDFEVGCEILTLRDGDGGGDGWRLVEDEFCPYPIYFSVPPVVNQALHWLVKYDYWYEYMQFPDVVDERIVAFNVMTEKFNVVSAPPYLSDVDFLLLMELRGFLALTSEYLLTSNMDIWILKDYYDTKSWVKEYVIDLSRMDNFQLADTDCVVPYYISDGEMLICCDEKRLDSYNIKTQCFRNLIKDNNWKPSKMKYCKWNRLNLRFYKDGFFSLARST